MKPIGNSWRVFAGEMETDEQDDESSQDQELPSENDNSQSEESVGGDNDLENGIGPEQTTKGHHSEGQRKRLFTFQFNNMGKMDFSYIKEEPRQIRFDEGNLRLSGKHEHTRKIQQGEVQEKAVLRVLCLRWPFTTDRSYLSLDWEPELKKKFFDESAAEVRDSRDWCLR